MGRPRARKKWTADRQSRWWEHRTGSNAGCQPRRPHSTRASGIPHYFHFDVPTNGIVELEVTRDASLADHIRHEHLAVAEGSYIKPNPESEGDAHRVGVGKGQVIWLAGQERRHAIGSKGVGA